MLMLLNIFYELKILYFARVYTYIMNVMLSFFLASSKQRLNVLIYAALC